jgi:amidophosphoribosyltransferase
MGIIFPNALLLWRNNSIKFLLRGKKRLNMSGLFGVVSKTDCVSDVFFGTDYHSHLGTKRGGMAILNCEGFNRAIHNIENSPFRTKFDAEIATMKGNSGIGCISDSDPQPLIVRPHTLATMR